LRGLLEGGQLHCNVSLWNASIEECSGTYHASDLRAQRSRYNVSSIAQTILLPLC